MIPVFARHNAPSDPYWSSVKSLLHFDGANGGTSIVDVISANTWAANGSAALTTSPRKFGSASLNVQNVGTSSVNMTSAIPQIGTSDFTIEFWGYISNLSSGSPKFVFVDTYPIGSVSGNNFLIQVNTNGTTVWYVGGTTEISAGNFTQAAWHHVAISRTSGLIKLFIDGTSVGSYTDSSSIISSAFYLGYDDFNNVPDGVYIDDLRLTIGVGRYTANFTPPTTSFPNH